MRFKKSRILAACFVLVLSQAAVVRAAAKDKPLQIYLPREIAVTDGTLRLGQVSILRGDESLVADAGKIELGRLSVPGQKVVVSRRMLMSRLACSGIPGSKVSLTGAQEITIRGRHRVITGAELIEMADAYLKENRPYASVCQWEVIGSPRDLAFSDMSQEVNLQPVLARKEGSIARVHLLMREDGRDKPVREVIFRLKHSCSRVVAAVDIEPGVIISPENVKVEKYISNRPDPGNWAAPYGLAANRRIAAGTVISANMAGPVKPVVLFKRDQNVLIRIDMLGFVITATGRSLEDGRAGEYIRVRNVDSRRIILAKVKADGTVEPVF